jgi:hypothetical protein
MIQSCHFFMCSLYTDCSFYKGFTGVREICRAPREALGVFPPVVKQSPKAASWLCGIYCNFNKSSLKSHHEDRITRCLGRVRHGDAMIFLLANL